MKKHIVHDIALMRDEQGMIFIMWYPSIPRTTVEKWVRGLPKPMMEMGPVSNLLNGVGGRIEMCTGIFRGISTYCDGPKAMEADLWDQLQKMIDTNGKGTCHLVFVHFVDVGFGILSVHSAHPPSLW